MKELLISNEIIVSFKKYSLLQNKMLYDLTYKLKNKRKYESNEEDSLVLEVTLAEIKEIIPKRKFSDKQLVNKILDGELLRESIGFVKDDYSIKGFISVFSKVKFLEDYNLFEFEFNKEYIERCENVENYFSKILLGEFNDLTSSYSQRMYELYVKFKNQKFYDMPIEHLRRFFSIPKSFSISKIDERIINKSIKDIELSTIDNKIIKVKKIKKRGIVTHYHFEF